FNTQQHSGGAIIDAQGREIPITEVMIQRACRELDRSLEQEQKQA
ncbi:PA1571 family protein, partial [Pseudomonas aeruginosa]